MSNLEQRNVEFKGNALPLLGWSLYSGLLSLLVIPAAWGAVALYRWFVRNISFSDGTEISFEGKAKDVWGYFSLIMIISLVINLLQNLMNISFLASLGLTILSIFISAALWLKIFHWFFQNIELGCGTRLKFTGEYLPYLGWSLLVFISVYTIIGWAWATAGMIRWFCRNLEGEENVLVFIGTGWGILWRSFVTGLASLFIIPIPWVMLWLVKWYVSQLEVRTATSVS